MATWEQWYDEVVPDVPGAGLPLIKNAIKNAAIEFCQRTRVYRIEHPAISAVEDDGEYDWAPGAGLKVVRAEIVWYEGKQLDPVTPADLQALYPQWTEETGPPVYFVQEMPETLVLVPKPNADAADAITARVSVKPSRAATSISDQLYELYLEQIAAGAKARLFAMQSKPWSNPQGAQRESGLFEDAIAQANLDAFRGHSRARNNSNRGARRFL